MTDTTEEVKPDFEAYYYFPSPVYVAKKPEFLEIINEVSEEELKKITQDVNEIYPMHNTDNYASDPRLVDFCKYLWQSGWNILNGQGYDMNSFNVMVDAVWTQEHYKHSLMEQHVHGGGHQLVGFYFLETPENCSRVMFHDPRGGKVQINLPEADMSNATPASNMINFQPEAGMMIVSNAWLPHSFGRHGSDKPIKFVHFNLSVQYVPQVCATNAAEVV
jgi:uncharacterized protein (TIGR02466 family)